jgi:hypothetical protein
LFARSSPLLQSCKTDFYLTSLSHVNRNADAGEWIAVVFNFCLGHINGAWCIDQGAQTIPSLAKLDGFVARPFPRTVCRQRFYNIGRFLEFEVIFNLNRFVSPRECRIVRVSRTN